MKRIIYLLFIAATILVGCNSESPATATSTVNICPAQPPEGWQNGGRFIQLRDTGGNIVGSLQLFLDEENGVLNISERESVFFPPGSRGELIIDNITTEFFFGCDKNFWFPPDTLKGGDFSPSS